MIAEFDEHHRAYSEKEMKELLSDNWPTVLRIGRHLERHSLLSPHQLMGAVSHDLCLQYRDFPVLQGVLESCSQNGTVNLTLLKDCVTQHGMPPLSFRGGTTQPMVPAPPNCRAASAGKQTPYSTTHNNGAPPYAVKGDHLLTQNQHRSGLEGKKSAFRLAITSAAEGSSTISRAGFFKAMNQLDSLSHREAEDLFSVLDPRRTGHVNVNEFCDRFTFEFLKPKSMRNTLGACGSDGYTNVFEWRGTLAANAQSQSPRDRPTTAGKSPNKCSSGPKSTKASSLRREVAAATRHATDDATSYAGELKPSVARAAAQSLSTSHGVTLPRPPSMARVRTKVVADARLMGNVGACPHAE